MTRRKKFSPPSDINQLAKFIIDMATEEKTSSEKNPAAVALGRLGGLKGGPARKHALSPAKRKEIARKAIAAPYKTKYPQVDFDFTVSIHLGAWLLVKRE